MIPITEFDDKARASAQGMRSGYKALSDTEAYVILSSLSDFQRIRMSCISTLENREYHFIANNSRNDPLLASIVPFWNMNMFPVVSCIRFIVIPMQQV